MDNIIRIGVDPHADTLAVCGIDHHGREVFYDEIPNTLDDIDKLVTRFNDPEVVWGIEGTGTFGRALCDRLLDDNRQVVEVPTRLTGRHRVTAGRSKTDRGDARAIAQATLADDCAVVTRDETTEALRLLTQQREQLVTMRTATVNRIRARLREIDPQLGNTPLRSRRSIQQLADNPPGDEHHQKVVEMDALNWLTFNAQIKELDQLINNTLPPAGEALTQICGIGVIGAATIVAHTRDITRFKTDGHYAMMCGTAPLDASSGRQQRHRLNPYGNRTLNRVIHTAIITQLGSGGEADAYVTKRTKEGKTKQDAIRSAKRKLTRRIYKTLHHAQLT